VTAPELVAHIRARLGDVSLETMEFRGELTMYTPPERILEVLDTARGATETPLMLMDLTAVDRHPVEPRFEIVYLLTVLDPPARLRVKTRVPGDRAVLPSVTSLWAAANWLEREAYDLFGISFSGHPDLARILMPDDWEGHPLRKDFSLTEEPVEFVDHVPKVPSTIIPRSRPRA
jgi:NADH-quinone oxidoreductase subunit C